MPGASRLTQFGAGSASLSAASQSRNCRRRKLANDPPVPPIGGARSQTPHRAARLSGEIAPDEHDEPRKVAGEHVLGDRHLAPAPAGEVARQVRGRLHSRPELPPDLVPAVDEPEPVARRQLPKRRDVRLRPWTCVGDSTEITPCRCASPRFCFSHTRAASFPLKPVARSARIFAARCSSLHHLPACRLKPRPLGIDPTAERPEHLSLGECEQNEDRTGTGRRPAPSPRTSPTASAAPGSRTAAAACPAPRSARTPDTSATSTARTSSGIGRPQLQRWNRRRRPRLRRERRPAPASPAALIGPPAPAAAPARARAAPPSRRACPESVQAQSENRS